MSRNGSDLTGQTLGTCTLEKLIGQGGMGVVYLARQLRPVRNVAVKVLLPDFAPNSKVYQEFLIRFRREADVIARLEHMNIMPIYEYGEQDGLAFLVMPYLAGGSLRDVLAKQNALSLTSTAMYMDQAASALDYAHAQGVIHRDLKPANFLLHADGRLVLADFGIARLMEEHPSGPTLTGTGSLVGTPEYMPPEMVKGEQPIDSRADIYELGVVLFQLLSGHVPFTGSTPYAIILKHVQEPLPLLHSGYARIPAAVDVVIQKATAKQREDRYTTAQALALALHAAITTPEDFSTFSVPDQKNIPTVIFPPASTGVVAPPPQYSTPLFQQGQTYAVASNPAWLNDAHQPLKNYEASVYINEKPPLHQSSSSVLHRWWPWYLVLGILLVFVLVLGSLFAGMQISREGQANSASLGSTSLPNSSLPTAQVASTVAPTTVTNYALPTTASTAPAVIPIGTQLYTTVNPGPACDKGGGQWINFGGAQISCFGNKTHIKNTAPLTNLQGIFLTKFPGQTYPANYVIQVQLQQDQQSSGDFGVYFRNQPGNQLGVYSLLIHPNGTWSAYVYDNNTGASTEIAKGPFGDVHALVRLTVVVNGSQFSFYANGLALGSVSNQLYSTGTAGITVNHGGSVVASNFTLYTIAT